MSQSYERRGGKSAGVLECFKNPGNLVDIPRMNKNFGVGISWDVHKSPKVQANLVRKQKILGKARASGLRHTYEGD